MQWFWRVALLSAAAGAGCFALFVGLINLARSGQVGTAVGGMIFGFALSFMPCLLAIVFFRRLAPKTWGDRETRCRNCSYILRGITEPRCPECGERI